MAIVGGVLIIASGFSLLDIKDCKTLNFIPALLVPVLWFLGKALVICIHGPIFAKAGGNAEFCLSLETLKTQNE